MKKTLFVLSVALFTTQLMAMETPSLKCFGTEPFWGITTKDSTLSLDNFGENAEKFTINSVTAAVGTQEGWATLITAKNEKSSISLIAKKESCNDGMSDEEYTYSAYVQTGDALLIGCCNDN